jgi:hypothetical protein
MGTDIQASLGAKTSAVGMIEPPHTQLATIGAPDFKFS